MTMQPISHDMLTTSKIYVAVAKCEQALNSISLSLILCQLLYTRLTCFHLNLLNVMRIYVTTLLLKLSKTLSSC